MTTLYLLVLVFPIVTNAIRWGNLIHRKEFSTMFVDFWLIIEVLLFIYGPNGLMNL